jgi:hypothetical protein
LQDERRHERQKTPVFTTMKVEGQGLQIDRKYVHFSATLEGILSSIGQNLDV